MIAQLEAVTRLAEKLPALVGGYYLLPLIAKLGRS